MKTKLPTMKPCPHCGCPPTRSGKCLVHLVDKDLSWCPNFEIKLPLNRQSIRAWNTRHYIPSRKRNLDDPWRAISSCPFRKTVLFYSENILGLDRAWVGFRLEHGFYYLNGLESRECSERLTPTMWSPIPELETARQYI